MSKASLEQRVLADPRLQIYACGRTDIETVRLINETAYRYPPGDFPPIAPLRANSRSATARRTS